MKIDNWPMDRIMRLPDWCFGRRWWVGHTGRENSGDVVFYISPFELPDKFVVWGVMIGCSSGAPVNPIHITMRLGSVAPTTSIETIAMERVFKGMCQPAEIYEFIVSQWDLTWMNCERILIESAGRRLVVEAIGDTVNPYEFTAALLISALPKEVPDWLISESGKNLI